MPDSSVPEAAPATRDVVFTAKWTDTTRHGYMRDYFPDPEPQSLPLAVANAALASGKATPWPPLDAAASDTGDPDADGDAD